MASPVFHRHTTDNTPIYDDLRPDADNILFVSPAGRHIHTSSVTSLITPPTSTDAMSTPETPIDSARVTGVRIFPALRRESLDLNQLEGGISTINGDDIDNVSRGLSKGVEWRGEDYFF